jgi:RNA polymerase sigma-70 factor (ECF subfamily)
MQPDEFLALVRRDRRAAGEWLIGAMGSRVYRLARHWLGQDAEDGAQDVFREVIRSLPRFRGKASPTTWCYRIAMNTLTDFQRKERRAMRTLSLEAADVDPVARLSAGTLAGFAESPFTRLGKKELRARVRHALEGLEDIYRTVLTLRTFENLSYAEIGEVLGVPVGTVKSRMAVASVKLAEKLQAEREV